MKILVTGTAGFIGFHLTRKLLEEGHEVTGLDSINNYYDQSLKYDRLKNAGIPVERIGSNALVTSEKHPGYCFIRMNLEDRDRLNQLFGSVQFDKVCNLAAQAGVRYSLTHPHAYIDSNITGFLNILEACRHHGTSHLVYASSSSVYGLNTKIPFSESDSVDHPISLYAVTKKSNELMAHTYSYLFNLPTTGLRFFTVYGPWGRPDMALFLFTKSILEGKPIEVFNNGEMERDFTYVDDIVDGISRILNGPAPQPYHLPDALVPDPSSSSAPYRVYNIGNSNPVKLMDFIRAIEDRTGRKAQIEYKGMQAGDVRKTWADVSKLSGDLGYHPKTSVGQGIANFIDWYQEYYRSV